MAITSITKKYLLGAIALILVMGLSMIAMTETVLRAKLEIKLQKRGVAIARSIARSGVNLLLEKQYVNLALLARDFRKSEEDIDYVFFVNAAGAVVAHTFSNGFPVALQNQAKGRPPTAMVIRRFTSDRGRFSDILIPIVGGRAGAVHVGVSVASVTRDIDEIDRLIVLAVIGLMLFGAALSLPVSRSLTRSIHRLAAAAEAVKQGDLRARAPVYANDEVGSLAAVFNEMVESRRQAEAILAAKEKRLRDITASLGEGVMVLDGQGHLVFMNPEAEDLLGWREAELQDRDIHELTHGRKADGSPYPAEECPNFRVLATGERATVDDEFFVRKDGTRFPVSYITTPIVEEGAIRHVVVAFRDSTLAKQREAERERVLAAYRDALENINTLQGLLPICSSCKRIRDEEGNWSAIEEYVREHTDAEFSHGLCPDCAQKLYPEYYRGKKRSGK